MEINYDDVKKVVGSSPTEEDVNSDSSPEVTNEDETNEDETNEEETNEEEDVNPDSSSEDSETKTVPYDRFKEVNEKMKGYREEIDELKSMIKSKDVDDEDEDEENETYSKLYDDPKKFAEIIKKQTIAEIKREESEKAQKKAELDRIIDDQISTLKKKNKDVDLEALTDFAEKYNIVDSKTGVLSLTNAYELINEIGSKKQDQYEKIVKKAKTVPVAKSTSTKESSGIDMSQQDLRKIRLDDLADMLTLKVK